MKKFCLTIISALVLYITLPAQDKEIRLLVRGDDMGAAHSINEAIIKCFTEGIQRSVEIIVPSPWFPEAVRLLNKHPQLDVGVHIALTSEWENIKYRPVSHCPSLTDTNGYFYPMIWANKNYPGQALLENKWIIEDVEKEMRAQIELALKHLPRISHISSHMNCAGMSKEVTALAKKLAMEYGIDVDLEAAAVESIHYGKPSGSPAEKTQRLLELLSHLKPGKTYLFVDHPGLMTPEMKAIFHIGYEDVALDRQGVTDSWTDKNVLDLIRKKNIKLISYADLAKKNSGAARHNFSVRRAGRKKPR